MAAGLILPCPFSSSPLGSSPPHPDGPPPSARMFGAISLSLTLPTPRFPPPFHPTLPTPQVAVPILTALAHLHAAGIIHRDIKLENLFVSPSRGIMLGDFGLALCVHEEKPISPVGTLEYMPPEILKLPSTDLIISGAVRADDVTPIDEKVDQWSFGVTVYELVTGRSPFEGASKDEIRANILRHNMRPLPGFLTPDCVDWITKAMTADPAARPSALQLLRHRWVLKNLHAEDHSRVVDLKIATPRMLPPAPAAVPAAAAVAAAAPGAGAAPAGEQGAAQPAAESGTQTAAGAAGLAAAAAAPLASKLAAKDGSQSPMGEVGGSIPAYMPQQNCSSTGSSAAVAANIGGSGGSTGSTGSNTSAVSVADSASSVAAGTPSTPAVDGKGSRQRVPDAISEAPAEAGTVGSSAQQEQQAGGQQQRAGAEVQQKLEQQQRGGKEKSQKKKMFKWMCINSGVTPGKEST